MKLAFLALSERDRQLLINEAAARRSLSPVILEKDFWVCWCLQLLFESPFASDLVFKGGTSLSKVYGAIERFSEDIDLSINPDCVGIQLPEQFGEMSRGRRDTWMKDAQSACCACVEERLWTSLEAAASSILGPARRDPPGRAGASSWFEFTKDGEGAPVLLFHYPSISETGLQYLPRFVKLEFGSLTNQQPTIRHTVSPWVAEEFGSEFRDWRCEVVALALERTFWEKATILHAEYHRPGGSGTPARYSRHYADLASLLSQEAGREALRNSHLLAAVVEYKGQFFARAWARYDLATPGTLRLAPHESRVADLREDYVAMHDMYLRAPTPFAQVISILQEAEDLINRAS